MPREDKSKENSPRIVNRRAWHDFHITEKLEVGVVLMGSEVKSIRAGTATLTQGFAMVDARDGRLYLHDVEIQSYPHAGPFNHEPKRIRQLLAHKREIAKLADVTAAKGATLAPLAMYFVRGKVKIELGIALGKKSYDKRQSIKERDAKRQIERGMTRKFIRG